MTAHLRADRVVRPYKDARDSSLFGFQILTLTVILEVIEIYVKYL